MSDECGFVKGRPQMVRPDKTANKNGKVFWEINQITLPLIEFFFNSYPPILFPLYLLAIHLLSSSLLPHS